MDNRAIAAERFIEERQYEASGAVALARLQREALEGAASDAGQFGGLNRLLRAFRRIPSLVRDQEAQRAPVRVELGTGGSGGRLR